MTTFDSITSHNNKQIEILWISDFFETGYGSASYQLLKSLENETSFNLHLLIINKYGNRDEIVESAYNKLNNSIKNKDKPMINRNNIYTISQYEIVNCRNTI